MWKQSSDVTRTTTAPPVSYPKWHNVVAGAAAGAGARFLTAPLDLLKIRRQLYTTSAGVSASFSVSTFNPLNLFNSMKQIVQTEGGLGSLFRGNLAATYLWIGYAAVQFSLYQRTADYFASYGQIDPAVHVPLVLPTPIQVMQPIIDKPAQIARRTLHEIGSNPTYTAFFSGATAGTCATLATYPFDICRTAFASQKTASQGQKSIGAFFSLAMRDNHQPIRTLFAGCGPAVLGIIPYMGLNFAIYDYLVKKGERIKVKDAGMAGLISGGTSKFLVYPLDTMKKRLQAQAFSSFWGGKNTSNNIVLYKNMWDCGSRIMKEEGIGAFYRGLAPTVLKTCFATSLTFSIFQLTKNTLESIHDMVYENTTA